MQPKILIKWRIRILQRQSLFNCLKKLRLQLFEPFSI